MRQSIAILEDNDDRIAAMRRYIADKFPFFELRVFPTAPEAIAWLRDHLSHVILISLDHDLEPSSESQADGDPGTGRDVADYLASQRPQCPVVIHSTNVRAALAMEGDLTESGWQVERITPYDDLAWVAEAWLPLARRLIVVSAKAVARTVDAPTPAAD